MPWSLELFARLSAHLKPFLGVQAIRVLLIHNETFVLQDPVQ
ncbi:hypothetical protein NOR53_3386 [gamma proteobacterium NOR5-3]|nr:hypothetical protein NOR53_3386 [gamma proteobacterium NOR5-3]